MGIKFHCPNGHKMNVKAFLAGKKGKCPKCGVSVRIPNESPADDDSGEDLVDAPSPAGAKGEPARAPAVLPSAPATVVASPAVPTIRAVAAPVVAVGAPAHPVQAPIVPVVTPVPQGYGGGIPAGVPVPGPAIPIGIDPIGQAPNAIWYVRPPSGGQYGPARGDIMRKWVAEGRVSGDSLVWREGFAEWKSAGQLFPSLASVSTTVPAAPAAPAAPAETAEIPKVSKVTRKLGSYEGRRKQGNGMAIAILVLLGIICVALVVGLAWVLSQGDNAGTKTPGGHPTHKKVPAATE